MNDLSPTLVVSGKHPTHHHKVGSGTEGLGNISRTSAASIRDDVTSQAVGSVRALQHSRQLRVAHPGLLPGCANRARADPDLDDVGAGEDQLLHHLPGHHVAGQDGVVGELCPHLSKFTFKRKVKMRAELQTFRTYITKCSL